LTNEPLVYKIKVADFYLKVTVRRATMVSFVATMQSVYASEMPVKPFGCNGPQCPI
jgi:hypothetical protein